VCKSGLCISLEHPFLAASPDGLVGTESIVEVKCPYAARNDKITPNEHFPFLTDSMQLKPNHNYYAQVQGQMYITKRSHCFFVIYTLVDFKLIEVVIDKDYCQQMIAKLVSFYENHYLPFLANRL
jgi:hypothetical protein